MGRRSLHCGSALLRNGTHIVSRVVPCFATARDFFTDAYFRGITRTYHPTAGVRLASFTVIPLPSLRKIYS